MLSLATSLIVYLTQLGAGWLVVRSLRGDDQASGWYGGPGMWARALLIGPAAIAVQMIAYDVLGVPFTLAFVLTPWWFALASVAALQRLGPCRLWHLEGPWHALLLGLAAAVVAIVFAGAACSPVHDGDAVHNYAIHARIFAAQGSLAPEAVLAMVDPAAVEYPPLLALNEALLFLCDEHLAPWTIRPFFALAHLSLVWLIIEAIWRPGAPRRSMALCLLVIAAPELCVIAGVATPDLRLTASVLLLGLQALELQAGNGTKALRFAVAAAVCGMTKNEGIALSAVAVVLLLLHIRRWRVLPLLALIVVLVGAWPVYRQMHGIPEQYWSGAAERLRPAALAKAIALVLGAFAAEPLARFPDGLPRWGTLWFVALFLGFVSARRSRVARFLLFCLLTHVAVYAVATAAGPHDVRWQLSVASDRLVMHLSPWLILLCGAWMDAVALGPCEGRSWYDPASRDLARATERR